MRNWFAILGCFAIITSNSAQVLNIEGKRLAEDSLGVFGRAKVEFAAIKNNQMILKSILQSDLLWKREHDAWLAFVNFGFGSIDGSNFINEGFSHLRYNHELMWETFILEAFVQAQYNQIQRVQFRQLTGAGLRVELFKKAKQGLFLGTLCMAEYEEIANESTINRDIRLSSYMAVNAKITNQIELISTTYYQPLAGRFADYRIANESKLNIKVGPHLEIANTYRLIHDVNPPAGVQKTMYDFTTGFEFRF